MNMLIPDQRVPTYHRTVSGSEYLDYHRGNSFSMMTPAEMEYLKTLVESEGKHIIRYSLSRHQITGVELNADLSLCYALYSTGCPEQGKIPLYNNPLWHFYEVKTLELPK